eukprot:389626-Rhodomonas_salina.1
MRAQRPRPALQPVTCDLCLHVLGNPESSVRRRMKGKEGDSQGVGTVRCVLLRAFMTHARNKCSSAPVTFRGLAVQHPPPPAFWHLTQAGWNPCPCPPPH